MFKLMKIGVALVLVAIFILPGFGFQPGAVEARHGCDPKYEHLGDNVWLLENPANDYGLKRVGLEEQDLVKLVNTMSMRMTGRHLQEAVTISMLYPEDRHLVRGMADYYGGTGGEFTFHPNSCQFVWTPGSAGARNMAFVVADLNGEYPREDGLIFGQLIHEISHALGSKDLDPAGWGMGGLYNAANWYDPDGEYHLEIAESAYYLQCVIYAQELWEAMGNPPNRRFNRDILPTFDHPQYLACTDLEEILYAH